MVASCACNCLISRFKYRWCSSNARSVFFFEPCLNLRKTAPHDALMATVEADFEITFLLPECWVDGSQIFFTEQVVGLGQIAVDQLQQSKKIPIFPGKAELTHDAGLLFPPSQIQLPVGCSAIASLR